MNDEGKQALIRRGRRWGWWAWVLIVLGLVAVSSPWVQVRLGSWFALQNDGPFILSEIQYFGFVDPPVRWVDLQKAAAGDTEAIGMLQRGFAAYDDIAWGVGPREEEDCSLQIVRPRYWFDATDADWGERDGERLRYSLESRDIARLGWPVRWATETTAYRYAYGGSRFAQTDRFIRVEDDMIKSAKTTRRVHWMNLVFLTAMVIGAGYVVWRVSLWRQASRRRARRLGIGTAAVLFAVIGGVGMRHRTQLPPGRIAGNFEAVLPEPQRVWSRPVLGEIMSSAEKTQALAKTVVDDFATMTEPGALVGLGIVHHAGPHDLEWGWGLGRFRFLSFGRTIYLRQGTNGVYPVVPAPRAHPPFDRFFYSADGITHLNWKRGEPAMVYYGALIMYRNIILLLMGLYVVWRVCAAAGVWWMERVSRRRIKRGVCVWCCYPCGDGG